MAAGIRDTTDFPDIQPAMRLVTPHTVNPIVNPIILIMATMNRLPIIIIIINLLTESLTKCP